jgi:hypothetical protein
MIYCGFYFIYLFFVYALFFKDGTNTVTLEFPDSCSNSSQPRTNYKGITEYLPDCITLCEGVSPTSEVFIYLLCISSFLLRNAHMVVSLIGQMGFIYFFVINV